MSSRREKINKEDMKENTPPNTTTSIDKSEDKGTLTKKIEEKDR